jgi:hypothetical protein
VDLDERVEYSPLRVVFLEKNGGGLTVFPSLALDEIAIRSDWAGEGFVEVFDMKGRWMTSADWAGDEAKISVAGFPVGSYVAVLRSSAGIRAAFFEKR